MYVFVDEISCTSIKFAFKIFTVAVELKSYSNIKGVNNTKSIKKKLAVHNETSLLQEINAHMRARAHTHTHHCSLLTA